MQYILIVISALLFSISIYGQNIKPDIKIPFQDSILLNEFWTEFKTAVITNDKLKLWELCQFPFYCHPCIDDTTLKENDHITIKVTKTIFNESQYKLFFEKPIKNLVDKFKDSKVFIFHPNVDDRNKIIGYFFLYTIISPSKKWEGKQGLIYLGKIKGKYRIEGIDTVP